MDKYGFSHKGRYNLKEKRFEFIELSVDEETIGDAFYITTELIRNHTDEQLANMWKMRDRRAEAAQSKMIEAMYNDYVQEQKEQHDRLD